jgi:hypothetical protein
MCVLQIAIQSLDRILTNSDVISDHTIYFIPIKGSVIDANRGATVEFNISADILSYLGTI